MYKIKSITDYDPTKYYQRFTDSVCRVDEDEARMCTIDAILNSYVNDPIAQLTIGVKQALKPDTEVEPGHYDIDDYIAMNDPCTQGITNLDRFNAFTEINNASPEEPADFSTAKNPLPSEKDYKKSVEPLAPAQSTTPSSPEQI